MPRVYVGNLNFKISWQDLKDHMRQAGTVGFCDIVKDESGRSKGCAFVGYAKEEECQTAIETLNDSVVGNRKIYVRQAEERKKPRCVGDLQL